MGPTVVLRPRMDHIDMGVFRRAALRPCRGCGSDNDHCLISPTGIVRCNACGRVSSVMKARPKPAKRRAAAPVMTAAATAAARTHQDHHHST